MKSALCLLVVACLGQQWRVWKATEESDMALTNSLKLNATSAISGYVEQADDVVTRKVPIRTVKSTEFTYGTGIGAITQFYSDVHSGATTATLTFSNSSVNDVKADGMAITSFKYLRIQNNTANLLFLTGDITLALVDAGATSMNLRPYMVYELWTPGDSVFPNGVTPSTMVLTLTAVVGNIDCTVEIGGS